MPPLGPAPLQIAMRIRPIGMPAGTRRRPPRPHPGDPGGDNCGVHPASGLRVQVAGFGHHQGSDILTDPSRGEELEVAGRSNHNARAIPSSREPSVGDTWQANAI